MKTINTPKTEPISLMSREQLELLALSALRCLVDVVENFWGPDMETLPIDSRDPAHIMSKSIERRLAEFAKLKPFLSPPAPAYDPDCPHCYHEALLAEVQRLDAPGPLESDEEPKI